MLLLAADSDTLPLLMLTRCAYSTDAAADISYAIEMPNTRHQPCFSPSRCHAAAMPIISRCFTLIDIATTAFAIFAIFMIYYFSLRHFFLHMIADYCHAAAYVIDAMMPCHASAMLLRC